MSAVSQLRNLVRGLFQAFPSIDEEESDPLAGLGTDEEQGLFLASAPAPASVLPQQAQAGLPMEDAEQAIDVTDDAPLAIGEPAIEAEAAPAAEPAGPSVTTDDAPPLDDAGEPPIAEEVDREAVADAEPAEPVAEPTGERPALTLIKGGADAEEGGAGAGETAAKAGNSADDLLASFRETVHESQYADLTRDLEDTSATEILAELREIKAMLPPSQAGTE